MDTRIRTALSLYAFALMGIFLLVAPWTAIWTRGTLALMPTAVGPIASSGWARGVVSGLGVLDLWAAFQAMRELWRDMRPRPRAKELEDDS